MKKQKFDLHETMKNHSGLIPPAGSDLLRRGFSDSVLLFDLSSGAPQGDGSTFFDVRKLNNGVSIDGTVGIKVSPFYLPLRRDLDPSEYAFGKIYLELVGLPSTQRVFSSGPPFHFEFSVLPVENNRRVLLQPVFDSFYFSRPVNTIDGIGLKFMYPPEFSPILFPPAAIDVLFLPGSSSFLLENGAAERLLITGAPILFRDPTPAPRGGNLTRQTGHRLGVSSTFGHGKKYEIPGLELETDDPVSCKLVLVENFVRVLVRFTKIEENIRAAGETGVGIFRT